jgi:hypothetical protein
MEDKVQTAIQSRQEQGADDKGTKEKEEQILNHHNVWKRCTAR